MGTIQVPVRVSSHPVAAVATMNAADPTARTGPYSSRRSRANASASESISGFSAEAAEPWQTDSSNSGRKSRSTR